MRRIQLIATIFIAWTIVGDASGLSFDFSFVDDANGTFASRGWLDPNSLFQRNIRAAADLWAAHIDSDETIIVDVDTHSFVARAGGTNTLGRYIYTNGEGKQVWEFGPLTRILTGQNEGEIVYGYDILLGFDAAFVDAQYWFDPQPELRTAPVPANNGDFMSVVLHELGHAFGFTGYRDFASGQVEGNFATKFDDLSYFGGDGNPTDIDGSPNPMFFAGDQSEIVYGEPLPLTHKPPGDPNFGQNFFHVSACNGGSPDGLEGALMNGCVLPNGQRLEISPVEVAVLEDIGYPTVTPTPDYNGNQAFDAADYVVWRNSLGETGLGLAADGNLNNQIDNGDYYFWRQQFGGVPIIDLGSGQTGPLSVPEPSTGLLLLASLNLAWGIKAFPRRAFRRAESISSQRILLQDLPDDKRRYEGCQVEPNHMQQDIGETAPAARSD
jgi:hypothetical protein